MARFITILAFGFSGVVWADPQPILHLHVDKLFKERPKHFATLWVGGDSRFACVLCEIDHIEHRLIVLDTVRDTSRWIVMPAASTKVARSQFCHYDSKYMNTQFLKRDRGRWFLGSIDCAKDQSLVIEYKPLELPTDVRAADCFIHSDILNRSLTVFGISDSIEIYNVTPALKAGLTKRLALDGSISAYGLSSHCDQAALGVTLKSEYGQKYLCRVIKLESPDKPVSESTYNDAVSSVCFFDTDSKLLVGSLDGSIHLWNLASGKLIKTLREEHGVSSVDFSPNGKLIGFTTYSTSSNLVLSAPDLSPLRASVSAHSGAAHILKFLSDDRVVTVGGDRTIKVWKTDDLIKSR